MRVPPPPTKFTGQIQPLGCYTLPAASDPAIQPSVHSGEVGNIVLVDVTPLTLGGEARASGAGPRGRVVDADFKEN